MFTVENNKKSNNIKNNRVTPFVISALPHIIFFLAAVYIFLAVFRKPILFSSATRLFSIAASFTVFSLLIIASSATNNKINMFTAYGYLFISFFEFIGYYAENIIMSSDLNSILKKNIQSLTPLNIYFCSYIIENLTWAGIIISTLLSKLSKNGLQNKKKMTDENYSALRHVFLMAGYFFFVSFIFVYFRREDVSYIYPFAALLYFITSAAIYASRNILPGKALLLLPLAFILKSAFIILTHFSIDTIVLYIVNFVSILLIYVYFLYSGIFLPFRYLFIKSAKARQRLIKRSKKLKYANMNLRKEIMNRILTEKRLVKAQQDYKFIMEMLPDGVCIIDEKMHIKYVNSSFRKICGLAFDTETSDASCREIVKKLFSKAQGDELIQTMSWILMQKDSNFIIKQYSINTCEGEKHIEVYAKYADFNGMPCLIITVKDISDKNKIQQLEKSIAESSKKLKDAIEMNLLNTEYFINLSHELKAPINILASTIQLFELYVNSGNVDKLLLSRKYIISMKQNCDRLVRLVNNIIDSSKMDYGFFEIKTKVCDILPAIKAIIESVTEYYRSKDIKLEFDTSLKNAYAICDPDKLDRVMLNILANAARYTPSGELVEVEVLVSGKYCTILVSDTGCGIPYEQQEIIFEKYRQASNNKSISGRGSGIGLSICKSIMEMQGGRILVSSVPDQGSTFAIQYLCATEEEVKKLDSSENIKYIDTKVDKNMIAMEFSDIKYG